MLRVKWQRFVAIGDSFTEGLDDPSQVGNFHGWADRAAATMSLFNPELTYANLAIRGRKLDDITGNQLDAALALKPDLISIAGGVNDAMRPRWDVTVAADTLERAVVKSKAAGADVVLFAFGELADRSRTIGTIGKRVTEYSAYTTAIAAHHDCYLLDFLPERLFDDPRLWAPDRLHLNPTGHERVAQMFLTQLGVAELDWRAPLPVEPAPSRLSSTAADWRWTRQHFVPWLIRHAQGKSSGDGVVAKRPTLQPVEPELRAVAVDLSQAAPPSAATG